MSPEKRPELDGLVEGLTLMRDKITSVRFFDEKISCETQAPSEEETSKLRRWGWVLSVDMGQDLMEKGEWWGWAEEGG